MTENTFEQEYLILGVGLTESILSAALATDKKLSVNIEAGFNYSGCFQSLSIKELERVIKENKVYDQKEVIQKDLKVEFLEEGVSNIDEFMEKYGYRGYGIDFNPRLIFSTGKATDLMVEAQIDNYITFRSLKGLYFADNLGEEAKMQTVPIDKGGIFQNKVFSLQEKKELFNFLNTAMRYFRKEEKHDEDNNSINDYKKNLYTEISKNVESVSTNSLDSNFVDFMKTSGVKSEKMIRLIASCMCNFRVSPFTAKKTSFEDHSAREMLKRLTRFVDSMHVHSELPYVYPIYGTGDITQVCSRISAVYGGIFLLGTEFQILDHKYTAEGGHETKMLMSGEEKLVKSKKVYIGPEYRKLATKFVPKEDEMEDANKPPIVNPSEVQMRYVAYICHLQEAEKQEDDEPSKAIFPLLCYLDLQPGSDDKASSIHPISCIITDVSCGTSPDDFGIVYFNYFLDESSKVDEEYLFDRFSSLVKRSFPRVTKLDRIFKVSHTQVYAHRNFEHLPAEVRVCPDLDFDMDMENIFLQAKKEVLGDKDEKLFKREMQVLADESGEHEDKGNEVLDELGKFSL